MADIRLISNYSGTGTLPYVIVEGRKINRADLDAFLLARVRLSPRQIFNARALQGIHVVWDYTILMTTVDLRDDQLRSSDGADRRTGAIFQAGEVAANARHIRLTIWTEINGNWRRAVKALRDIVKKCPQLQRLEIDIAHEMDRGVSLAVRRGVMRKASKWTQGRTIRTQIKATVVDDPDE